MKKFYIQIVSLLLLAMLTPNRASAQTDDGALYQSLKESFARLTSSEDSLNVLLTSARKLYAEADDEGKAKQGEIILDLEAKIFSLHSSLEDVASQMQKLEHKGITTTINTSIADTSTPLEIADDRIFNSAGGPDKVMLIENAYFEHNLPADVYASLVEAQTLEKSVDNYLQIIRHQYDKMIALDSQFYQATDVASALSIYNEFHRLDAVNAQISDSIATKQQQIIDTKSYAYNLILDKEDKDIMMEEFSNLMIQMQADEQEVSDLSYSRSVALYPLHKKLTLTMERDMAEALSIAPAVDSLTRALRVLAPNVYLLPPIVGPELAEEVEYVDAVKGTTSIYSSRNPIPEAIIPDAGTVYRILVGSYTQKQAINIFRNASPLSVERKSDKKYYYYVGDYPTFATATAGVDSLRAMGFRQPRIVVWCDGEYTLEPTEEVGMKRVIVENQIEVIESETTAQPEPTTTTNNRQQGTTAATTIRHRIEIHGAGSALSESVRDAIRTAAPGKEISRLVDGATGKTIFVVGTFPEKDTAVKVAEAIIASDGSLSTKIVELNR